MLEQEIVKVVDLLAPIKRFENEFVSKRSFGPNIKNLINKRKRLLRRQRVTPTPTRSLKIKTLDNDLKNHFFKANLDRIRGRILPGDNKSLWAAVKLAKNQSSNVLPSIKSIRTG